MGENDDPENLAIVIAASLDTRMQGFADRSNDVGYYAQNVGFILRAHKEFEDKKQRSYESLTDKSKDLNPEKMLRLHQSLQEHETLLREFNSYQAEIHAKVAERLKVVSNQTQKIHEVIQKFEKKTRIDVNNFKQKRQPFASDVEETSNKLRECLGFCPITEDSASDGYRLADSAHTRCSKATSSSTKRTIQDYLTQNKAFSDDGDAIKDGHSMNKNATTQNVVNLDDDNDTIDSITVCSDSPPKILASKENQSGKNRNPAKFIATTMRRPEEKLDCNADNKFSTSFNAKYDNRNRMKPTGHQAPVVKRSDDDIGLRSLDAMDSKLEDSDGSDFVKESADNRAQSGRLGSRSSKRKRNSVTSISRTVASIHENEDRTHHYNGDVDQEVALEEALQASAKEAGRDGNGLYCDSNDGESNHGSKRRGRSSRNKKYRKNLESDGDSDGSMADFIAADDETIEYEPGSGQSDDNDDNDDDEEWVDSKKNESERKAAKKEAQRERSKRKRNKHKNKHKHTQRQRERERERVDKERANSERQNGERQNGERPRGRGTGRHVASMRPNEESDYHIDRDKSSGRSKSRDHIHRQEQRGRKMFDLT